jgi:hypothetical protein
MAHKTYNGLPIFEATIGDNPEAGINKISLVDYPAVESDFLSFAKKERQMNYAIQNEEKRLVRGVIMRADFPIYRNNEQGEYYIVYKADTIREMAEKYLFDGKQNNVNLMHEDDSDVEGVNMVQFFIKDVEHGVNPEGFEEIEDGSLFAEFHVCNDEVWDQIKAGEYKGFSLEGRFYQEQLSSQREEMGLLERTFKKLFKTDSMSKLEKFKSLLAELLADQTEEVKMSSMTTDKGVLSWDGEDELKQGDAVYILDETGERSKPEDGEYASEDKIFVVADGKIAEIKDKPAEGEEQKPAEEKPEEMAEDEGQSEETDQTGSLEERVAKIEEILDQLMEYFGILRLQKDEVAKLRSEIETLKKQPAADPAHKAFKKVVTTETTGNKGLDNLRKICEA